MTWSSELRKAHSKHDLTSFLKTLVDGPAGFELTTSRSTDRRYSNWANRAVNSYWHRKNDLLMDSSKTNCERMTGQPTIWLTIK